MNRLSYLSMRGAFPAVGLLAALGLSTAFAEIQSGELRVKSVQGVVTYSTDQSTWRQVKPDMVLQRGAILRTEAGSSADLVFEYSGTVLRMTPDSLLELARLDKEVAGENIIVETSLNLKSGSIVGSQRKLAKPSKFEITVPGVVTTIRGTEYAVRANGTVTCFSGAVSINYSSPQRSGSAQAQVPAGFSFNPASCQVRATTSDCLKNSAPDIQAVRECAQACKGGKGEHCEEPRCPISPTGGDHDHDHGHDHDDGHGHDHGHDQDHGRGDDHQGHGR